MRWFWRLLLAVNVLSVLASVATMAAYHAVWLLPVVAIALGLGSGAGCVWKLRRLAVPTGTTTLAVADPIPPGAVIAVDGEELLVVVSCTGTGPFTLNVRGLG